MAPGEDPPLATFAERILACTFPEYRTAGLTPARDRHRRRLAVLVRSVAPPGPLRRIAGLDAAVCADGTHCVAAAGFPVPEQHVVLRDEYFCGS